MTRKIAVVIDSSASMSDCLDLFTLNQDLGRILFSYAVGCRTEKLRDLLKEYDRVYFFTDGSLPIDWTLILNNRIIVVRT